MPSPRCQSEGGLRSAGVARAFCRWLTIGRLAISGFAISGIVWAGLGTASSVLAAQPSATSFHLDDESDEATPSVDNPAAKDRVPAPVVQPDSPTRSASPSPSSPRTSPSNPAPTPSLTPPSPPADLLTNPFDSEDDFDDADDELVSLGAGVGIGSGSEDGVGIVGGYIDPAHIRSRTRVRYDNMRGANAPTRAEFLYPTIGIWNGPGPASGLGGVLGAGDLNVQELSTYVEVALLPRLSVFGDFPVRWLDPLDLSSLKFSDLDHLGGDNANVPVFAGEQQRGAGDLKAGLRFGIVDREDEWLTIQVTVSCPTGNARQGLGVGHSSLDVGLLYHRELSERWTLFGELRDWQTTDGFTLNLAGVGGEFDGSRVGANVARFGFGLGYDVWRNEDRRLIAVFEVVGWTVLDGLETAAFITPTDLENQGDSQSLHPTLDGENVVRNARGDTIVNGKYGLRYNTGSNSLYVGYGQNWTIDRWYGDLFRVELTHAF